MVRPYYINYTTAVVLFAPHDVQEIAVPLMQRYSADNLLRLPAHITLLFPWVPFAQLDAACAALREVCAGVQPFEVTLHGYDTFPGVTYMKPVDPQPLIALFQVIFACFPEYPPYGGAFGSDLVPHITVGEFNNNFSQFAAHLPDYSPVTFQAERLHIVYGVHRVALPWMVWDVVRLGSSGGR